MASLQRIRPEGLVVSPAFSHVAVVPPGATTIYVGGQNAVDANDELIGKDDIAVQSTRALANAKTALAAAGYGAISADLASAEPALITAAQVAGLGVPGALVEINAVAAVLR